MLLELETMKISETQLCVNILIFKLHCCHGRGITGHKPVALLFLPVALLFLPVAIPAAKNPRQYFPSDMAADAGASS
jgi:hypothetical protein